MISLLRIRALFTVSAVLFTVAMVLPTSVRAAVQNPDAVAVIIGNKNYKHDRIPEVSFAHRDADAVKRYVIDVLGYREGNIIDLRDATQAEVVGVFGNESSHRGRLFQYIRPGESDVTVYYSGHGVPGLRDRRGYLLPADGRSDTVELNGYPIDLLYKNLAKSEARSVTVYIDACFSGDSPKGMLVQSASPVFVKASLPKSVGRLTVITAASGDQLASWDEKARLGLFTNYLLKGLYGQADQGRFGNGDGKVTARELKTWLDREMTYAARRQYNRDQKATILGDDNSVLGLVPGDKSPPKLAEEKPDEVKKPAPVKKQDQVAVVTKPPKPEAAKKPEIPLVAVKAAYVTRRNANVRDKPSVRDGKVVTRLAKDTEVYVPGKTADGGWYRVERGGKAIGYVHRSLLQDKAAKEAADKKAAEVARLAARERQREPKKTRDLKAERLAEKKRQQQAALEQAAAENKRRQEWASLQDSRDADALKGFIRRHPGSPEASVAQQRLSKLNEGTKQGGLPTKAHVQIQFGFTETGKGVLVGFNDSLTIRDGKFSYSGYIGYVSQSSDEAHLRLRGKLLEDGRIELSGRIYSAGLFVRNFREISGRTTSKISVKSKTGINGSDPTSSRDGEIDYKLEVRLE